MLAFGTSMIFLVGSANLACSSDRILSTVDDALSGVAVSSQADGAGHRVLLTGVVATTPAPPPREVYIRIGPDTPVYRLERDLTYTRVPPSAIEVGQLIRAWHHGIEERGQAPTLQVRQVVLLP